MAVDVLCPRDPVGKGNGPATGVRVFTIPLVRNDRGAHGYLIEYGVALVLYTLWLFKLYIRNRYAIIHVHNMPDFLILSALVPRLLGARIILDIHDPMPEVFLSKFGAASGSRLVRVMEWQEKLSTRCADAVITANANFKRNLIRRGVPPDKITVVNNLPDPVLFRRDGHGPAGRARADHLTLIYPGSIAPRYGVEIPIRALPRLRAKIPCIRLVIVGRQPEYVGPLVALAETLGVGDLVEFIPPVPVCEVPDLITQADAGIYPGLRDPHMSIAMPTKVLEYVALGIPVIASRLTVLEETFDEKAVLFFEPGDVEQFSECVLQLFEHPARGAEMVRQADKQYSAQFSWKSESQLYLTLLNRLLSRDSRAGPWRLSEPFSERGSRGGSQ
jgi:glycosyltransferase involved in cell wall biosynthesis